MVDFVNDYKEKIGMCAPNAEEWGNPNPMTAWKLLFIVVDCLCKYLILGNI